MAAPLNRYLNGPALVFLVVGDILGAGIYSVTGKVADAAGYQAWLGFMVAMVAATFTGLSYAELGSRYSKSGGEAFFSLKAFGSRRLSSFIGWLVLCSGISSMATVSHAFAGYLNEVVSGVPPQAFILAFIILICYVNYRGIKLSSWLNILCTIIELTGLIIVIVAGSLYLLGDQATFANQTFNLPDTSAGWKGVFQGAVLAFFAFIGFEDLVNIAEEAKAPHKTLPRAIIISLAITGLIYFLIAAISTAIISPQELSRSDAPLLMVMAKSLPGFPAVVFAGIALFAILNTALLNNIMASRLLYGMSDTGLLPPWLARINPQRQTPLNAIILVGLVTAGFAMVEGLQFLAGTTSILILSVFLCMNVSLITIKLRKPPQFEEAQEYWHCPMIVPVAGILSCFTLMAFGEPKEWVTVVIFSVIGLVTIFLLASVCEKEGS